MNDITQRTLRKIRSFVLREGRLTLGQQRALKELLPRFGLSISTEQKFNFDIIFNRHAPVILEIGFGNGESLAQQALQNPHLDFIGIEVHKPGIGHLLMRLEELQLTNVRVLNTDAVEVLQHAIAAHSLHGVQLFFPDPWHKKKHHKRRIVQSAFIEQLHILLATNGWFHVATDWTDYAVHTQNVMMAFDVFEKRTVEYAIARPETKFERRGLRLGHEVTDLVYRKK
ncbi:MAG: tRNA (guanosine(46)-N7)-methyltransferase TrmB [Gammaproteobacteria bacterium]|nr:tRNA (guanosine(46)-N7)-methyltransferase TrmB [Gammaproteobacteria bacterium]